MNNPEEIQEEALCCDDCGTSEDECEIRRIAIVKLIKELE